MGSATATRSCGSTDDAAPEAVATDDTATDDTATDDTATDDTAASTKAVRRARESRPRDQQLELQPALASACIAFAAGLALLFVGSPAHAQRVATEARVAAGWDSNASLAADPGNRRSPRGGGPMPAPAMDDAVFRIGGFAAGEVGHDLLVGSARFDLDGRAFGSGDALFFERLRVGLALRLDPITPRCGVQGSRLDIGFSDDASWTIEGSCGARLDLPFGFRLDVEGWGGARSFDQGQTDILGGGDVSVGWTLAPLSLELGFSVVRREADRNDARRTELSPRVVVRLSHEVVGGELVYRAVAREFEVASQSGVEHVGQLALWVNPLPWIGPFAELELGTADGKPQALRYERVQVVAGVRLALDWRPEPDALPPPDETQGPVTVRDGRARFRFALDALPDAGRVSVVGDFDGWDEDAGRLSRGSDGAFEGDFEVIPGPHRYHLIVDGEPRRPPGAERYLADDFGGEDGVFEAPE
jgi:hypothetical protein